MSIGLQDLTNWLGSRLNFERHQFAEILTAEHHSTDVRRHRATVIISRVQMVAAVFAVLVPFWCIVDVLLFDWPLVGLLLTARFVSGLVLLALAWPWPWKMAPTMGLAYVMLATLLAVPPFFYLVMMPAFEGLDATSLQTLAIQAYAILPFVVVAGLSVFPLTALEGIAHSLPVFAITAVTAGQASGFSWEVYIGNIWLMLLIIGVSLLSGMSQLHYIINLINRASLDPLTGAHTRRSGAESIDLAYRVATMQDAACAVAFVDIDNFKSINDTHGHDVGDRILQQVANALTSHLRGGDDLIRWGGEEFVILLGKSDPDGVQTVMERIMGAGFGPRPDGKPLTASIGVAEKRKDQTNNWEDLIDCADKRMYAAKMAQKDCCLLWDGRLMTRSGLESLSDGDPILPPDQRMGGEKGGRRQGKLA